MAKRKEGRKEKRAKKDEKEDPGGQKNGRVIFYNLNP